MQDEVENLKNKYIKTFDEFARDGKNYWLKPIEIASITGTTASQVTHVVKATNSFVMNSKGEITSKDTYIKKEKFSKRVKDMINGRIE